MVKTKIKPTKYLQGKTCVPGDKSISHRALLLAAIAEGTSEIYGLSSAADVNSTRKCLQELGIAIETSAEKTNVQGNGKYGFKAPQQPLDAGNSGTTIRLLTGILAAQKFVSCIDGDASLQQRPMRRIIEPLERMGARIDCTSYQAPLTIHGANLKPIDFVSPIASAQVKSCILLAGLYANGITTITEPARSRDHTERMLTQFGVSLLEKYDGVAIKGPVSLQGGNIYVPGDISSAAFLQVAASLLPGSEIEIQDVGINPTRTGIIEALETMGASIMVKDGQTISNEPRGTIVASSSRLKSTVLRGGMIPKIIDEIPILAIAATRATGTTIIRDARELRVKETDRVAAVCDNLRRMGANVQEYDDGFDIIGPCQLHGAELDSFGDHRIAMAFAVAALVADAESTIKNSECVNISFPGFFNLMEKLRRD